MKSLIRLHLVSVLLVVFSGHSGVLFAMEKVPGVLHLATTISGAPLSPEEMVGKVKEVGLKVAILTDEDSQRVEYGIFPLRQIIRKVEERPSIKRYGAEKYLGLIENIAKQNPEMTVIAGVEAAPFYYWQGSYLSKDLKLVNYHKQLLVIGLEKPEDLEGIPSVDYHNPLKLDAQCILNAWPLLIFPVGAWLLLKKKEEHVKLQLIHIKKRSRPFLVPGIIALSAGLLFTINNFPFCPPLYDQYHGDRGSLPYQNLIDYVDKKGGMVFWAHPDEEGKEVINAIELYTHPYYEELLRTNGYTGFAALASGMKYTAVPGGIWDAVLKQYISGLRKRPVWAIGALDYKEGPWMGETQTVFFVNRNSKPEILDAMRKGRMYAVSGDPKPVLDGFQIWDDVNKSWVEMGGMATVDDDARLKIKVSLPGKTNGNLKLRLIREGVVIKEISLDKDLDIELTDKYLKTMGRPGAKTYYRLDIDGRLISNPIFVETKSQGEK